MDRHLLPTRSLRGTLRVPGDKSVTHRGLMLGALAQGQSWLYHPLKAGDTLSTARVMQALGAEIREEGPHFHIQGVGLGLKEPGDVLDCGNAGTLIRLLSGLLAGQEMFAVLTGDASLRRRPMGRVTAPLRQMGARIEGRDGGRLAPLAIRGGGLKGIRYELPVASAQVKSAVLLAGLFAEGETEVTEPAPTRDHTERIFRHYGLPLEVQGNCIRTRRAQPFAARNLTVPGDFSSAAFFLVAALITPDSEVALEGVGLNPTRTGLLTVLKEMGADLSWEVTEGQDGEPVGWIRAKSSPLRGVAVDPSLIPLMVDEIPILSAAAAWAEGETFIPDLEELRVKESDRLEAIAKNLNNLGVKTEVGPDWIRIFGGGVQPGHVEPFHDHRIAMAFAVCGLPVGVTVHEAEWASISFPSFWEDLDRLRGED
ncbi:MULTISPECIES: 3-phosphoshikimate 1-carboxyvinyltransferase [unclassified Meiothermus]|uniref:3-phosphoshikimate 1-carboxyvinyltransferase n=1 Tax=unclassified Meiothermus TaxID=370471 RepID=UPI000D7CE952|nr:MULTISPECIES: 3-phosphoshikimate 1-carboxyvinyltransferase [unclassified Meiothermus]PZA07605.1 3-phosphoshikimate 1-carboxyvinyltransferase [Meiothermus sp. Pnk-1]RYM36822.1 3-phosphoshikimate 1-carboxyvinyltransferase [Meiothermus sp. PNK-Is4]